MIPTRLEGGTFAWSTARWLTAWAAFTVALGFGGAAGAADLAEILGETTAEQTAAKPAEKPADTLTPDPLAGSPWIDPATTGPDAESVLATLLPPRSDSPLDWMAPLEPLHDCGEPRLLPRRVPPPPCHPALPPCPYDLVGAQGAATCGPIYGGPCAPRTGTHDASRLPRVHRVHDRLFDWFYRTR